MSVEGVADVNRFGGKVRQYQIKTIPKKLIENNISLQDIFLAAQKSSAVRGAGFIQNKIKELLLIPKAKR